VWILDERLRPLPPGVPGEICIGGEGLAQGYLHRAELTAERFVTVAFDGAPERIYRTGDRGRWRNDGRLAHLGRNDHQVKVRGYRIELGEIETRCNEAPGVARSVVLAREDQPGDVRLVAYLVAAAGVASIDRDAVTQHLRQSLPQYMLPQHLVTLETIPLLPNGKVDRRMLPPPSALAGEGARAERVAPRTERERIVLETMEGVLHQPGLGIHDDFFALGGHSLLAARLAKLLGTAFGIPVPMRLLFESPTAERLARAIDEFALADAPRRAPLVHRPGRTRAPLTPMQARIRFIEELHPGRPVYNQPSTHRFGGALDAGKFEAAFRAIVARQSALRTSMGTDARTGAQCQVIAPAEGFDFPFPVIDLSGLTQVERESRLSELLRETIDRPLDIHAGPLFRVALFRLASDDHAFVFVPHHLIWDGWSFDLYQAELSTIYGALLRGEASALPELPVSMGDYAQWYDEWLASPEAKSQLGFWKSRFAAAPAARAPRTDLPRKAGMSGQGGTHWISIDQTLTERLREVARGHDVTLNMLALGMYVLMMASVIDTDALVVATPVRGREQPEVEAVMGFFNNVLPLAFRLDRTASLADFMRYVKKELIAVMNHQQIPFERLVAEPEFSERAHGVGLYQALFSFQDARERPLDFGGLSHRQIHILQSGATDDLGMWLMEKPHGLEGAMVYNADIYLPETGAAFKERYVELLRRAAAEPGLAVDALLDPTDSPSARLLSRLASTAGAPASAALADSIAPAVHDAPASEAPMALLPPEQARLAQVWASALDIDVNDIRASDNFFDLGGDSLLAMRVVEQSEQALGFRIEPRRYVFESLAQLAVAPVAAPEEAPSGITSGFNALIDLASGREPAKGGLIGRVLSGWRRKN
jgi:acyl carrier protein